MPAKTIVAKYLVNGDSFEIFVNSDLAYDFITGKIQNPMTAVEVEEIFMDANKGERQSQDKVQKAFGTTDIVKVCEAILKKGNVPITTEQRNKLIAEKRKQIVAIIARNAIDPRTNTPHPPQRIENAINDAKVTIEPFKNANEQVDAVVKKISMALPIKFASVRIEVRLSAMDANRCYGTLKQYGMKSENWLSDGSLSVVVEFPAGMQGEFFEKINNLTHGNAITKIIE